MPSLAEFQREFSSVLLTGAHGNRANSRSGLIVHRNTFMKALVDALRDNYPTVGVLTGQEWLANAARGYVLEHPPHGAVLAIYGESFPDFLHAMGDRLPPYLPGVAELDRAWMHSLLAPDVPALDPRRVSAGTPQALASLRLRLHPAAHFGVYRHSAVSVWRANRPPATPPEELCVDDGDEAALIVRNPKGVQLLALDEAARVFFSSIVCGDDVTAAAIAVLQMHPDADVAAMWSTYLLSGAFAEINDGD